MLHPVQVLEREAFIAHNKTPAPQVEFEIRHTREHLEKLKFNLLELQTKSGFLRRLMDAEEWSACQTSRWTPGELKQLERAGEPTKMRLKGEKGRTQELQRMLAEGCEQLRQLEGETQERHTYLAELIARTAEGEERMRELAGTIPPKPTRSVEELQGLVDEQSIALEKKTSALERQRSALADLERLLAMHETENDKLEMMRTDLVTKEAALTQKRNDSVMKPLADLCRWYAMMKETLGRLTGCKVEMVHADYLVVSVQEGGGAGEMAPVQLHVNVDPVSGRLLGVRVGATSGTPKRAAWKEIVETALECNDLAFLVRAVLQETALSRRSMSMG